MSPREAATALKLLQCRKVIPMHFGTFPPLTGRPDQLVELIHSFRFWSTAVIARPQVWPLEPGKTVEW